MQPFDIVGYTYKADIYCPTDVVSEVAKDYEIVLYGSEGDIESDYTNQPYEDRALKTLAILVDIDYADPHSYDSDDFPKVIFADQIENERCCLCDERLKQWHGSEE